MPAFLASQKAGERSSRPGFGDAVGAWTVCSVQGTFQNFIETQTLPRPSNVVPFWVVYYDPLQKNHNRPKQGLHRSPWVDSIGGVWQRGMDIEEMQGRSAKKDVA